MVLQQNEAKSHKAHRQRMIVIVSSICSLALVVAAVIASIFVVCALMNCNHSIKKISFRVIRLVPQSNLLLGIMLLGHLLLHQNATNVITIFWVLPHGEQWD